MMDETVREANGDEARDYAAEELFEPTGETWQTRAAATLTGRVLACARLFSDEQLTRIVGGCERELRRRKNEPPAHPFALSPVDADRMLRGGT